ncbi:hypothetical protein CHS0354_011852 [Potamilus streckersoni]|uniref:RING-type domain-containing protein n=1 Tax=Potamilus streckersoni TaxID=2493646 RepID=A0AAE0SE11_9BIVA|nr:hypothetical protein CHS0354_011852 [Potamilus streckersoni]
MARCPIATRNAESPLAYISLQDAIVHMIGNPSDFTTNQSIVAGNIPQSEENNDNSRLEPQRRSHSEEQQQQWRNDTEKQQSPRRNDTPEENPYESRDERHQHLPEGQERIRNELAENDVPSVANYNLETDSIENPLNSDGLASLPSCNRFMMDSFCLPTGSRIRSPQYQTFSNRLSTFKNWPNHLTQTPRELAHAGFYSLGKDDVVRCFSCDGGLKNWEPEDDPWIEHARWFSDCDYLRHVKGEEFIQLVRLVDDESEAEDEQPLVHDEEQTVIYLQTLNLHDNQDGTEPSVLDADCAQSVVQTGVSDMTVARAINYLLKEGREEFGSQDILTVILDNEEDGNVPRQAEQSLSSRRMNTHTNEEVAAKSILQENDTLKRQVMCTECGENERNVLFLPCRHHTVCANCSPHIYVCFTCFRRVRQKVKTYMS